MIKITEEDNKGVYVCSQLLSSIKEFKNLKELIDSKRILESGKTDFKKKSNLINSYIETASNAIGNFRASLQTIAKQIKNSLQNRKNDLQQSGPDAIDKKYRNSIEQPIFFSSKRIVGIRRHLQRFTK